MDDREKVEAWADALLERHRSGPAPDPGPRWYRRELPRTFAFMKAAEAIGMVLLALGGLALVAVAFNSG